MSDIHWFKGTRRYIQAADLVGVAVAKLAHCETFDFASRKMADHPVRWLEAGSTDKQQVLATFHATANGQSVDWIAVQDNTQEIHRFDPFEEERMFAVSRIEQACLTSPLIEGFSLWEHISSLNKLLLTRLFDHPSWWFVRLAGDARLISSAREIEIRYLEKKRILFRSDIRLDGRPFGTVDFAQR